MGIISVIICSQGVIQNVREEKELLESRFQIPDDGSKSYLPFLTDWCNSLRCVPREPGNSTPVFRIGPPDELRESAEDR